MPGYYQICIIFGALVFNVVVGFGGSEEKFIKKYAMMKVYESCFGPQVLKEIRKEMKDAAQKCSGLQPNFDDKYSIKEGNNIKQGANSDWVQEQPYRAKPSLISKVRKPIHTTDTLLLQQWTEEQKHSHTVDASATHDEQDQLDTESASGMEIESTSPSIKPVDFSKLEEAIMNIGRPMGSFAIQKPNGPGSNFQQSAAVGYYPAMYYPPPVPFAPSYPYHAYYPGYFQQPPPAGSAAFQSYYRSGHRSAKLPNFKGRSRKQLDMKAQIDAIAFQYSPKIRNVSCIMQELGYLDENLEPNYSRMTERIGKLDISEELKKDMLDGVKFCRQFSQCLPETRKDPFQLSKELFRPMFFFRCYKHKKLEACVMKDIRERFSQTSADINNEVRRSFRNNDIIGNIFDSIFGSNGDELESFL